MNKINTKAKIICLFQHRNYHTRQTFLRKQALDAYILFDQPQRGITPGQFAAWYDGDELVGSGVISE